LVEVENWGSQSLVKLWHLGLIAGLIWWLLPRYRVRLIGLLLVLVGVGVG
jgi:hypothetical protein